MKKLLLAFGICSLWLVIFYTINFVGIVSNFLDVAYSGHEVNMGRIMMTQIFWKPLIGFLILQTLLILVGYLLCFTIVSKMKKASEVYLLGGFVVLSFLSSALLLGSVEPIIATDYFEYGVRQELNRIFEFIGYQRINISVYLYALSTAVITWLLIRKQLRTVE